MIGSDHMNRTLSRDELERQACDSMIRYIVSLLVALPHHELVGVMCHVQDVRERRRAEQRAGGSTDAARRR